MIRLREDIAPVQTDDPPRVMAVGETSVCVAHYGEADMPLCKPCCVCIASQESVYDAQGRSEHVATGYAGSLHAYCPRPRTCLEGLTVEDLHAQPGPASNSIAWLAWHLTRSHDR